MVKIPPQLHNLNFRFYLVKKNSKLPYQSLWNSVNNYPFFHSKLLNHDGNYGIVCGFGSLIVIDFDDLEYYNEMNGKLPCTFTVQTANKRLFHLYYYLVDDNNSRVKVEDMPKKVGIDFTGNPGNSQNTPNSRRVCDIQAARSGIIGPNSSINGRCYDILNPSEIQCIKKSKLETLFNIELKVNTCATYKKSLNDGSDGLDSDSSSKLFKSSINFMKYLGIKRTSPTGFMCPFHSSSNENNLHVFEDNELYCFHCEKGWSNVFYFGMKHASFKKDYEQYHFMKALLSDYRKNVQIKLNGIKLVL